MERQKKEFIVFQKKEDIDDALMNWMGEYYESLAEKKGIKPEEIKVSIIKFEYFGNHEKDVNWELALTEKVMPSSFKEVYNEDWTINKNFKNKVNKKRPKM